MGRNTIVNLTRLGTVKKSQKMKRVNVSKVGPNTEWAKRVLESQALISVKEVFNLKPKLIKDFIKSLRQFVKKKERGLLYAEGPAQERDSDSSEESEEESGDEDDDLPPLSCLTTYVKKEPIPLFLDPGAAYSIISTELLKSLNINTGELITSIKIKPVSGKVVEIRKRVELPIEFDDGIIIGIPFIVIKECAVPILLGLDTCMRLKSKINYEEETYAINLENKKHTYQLYSKDNVIR
ncbi:hypothetical protein AYI69_g1520 [Smittium culicis]|uniref:Aspartic peptidase DDI1-type domain-containing protein n=1 Tax=Smittium culicis TaxID=133412 RepID=A0A1R1YQ06_9FUNG|nr:hypothetical protein AYI69_g1520 [Smittium culicis]